MRRTVRFISLTLLLLFLLSSCVTRSPIGDEQYFQGLGLDGEFVITINAQLLDVDQYIQSDDTAVNYITERMTRLSIALYVPAVLGVERALRRRFPRMREEVALEKKVLHRARRVPDAPAAVERAVFHIAVVRNVEKRRRQT